MKGHAYRRPSRCLIVVGASPRSLSISIPTQRLNSISWRLEQSAHHLSSISKHRLLKLSSLHQQISRRNDNVMVIHTEPGCIRKRAIDRDPDANHQVTVNMIARSGACARARAQARGRALAPLPARGAMALAPPSKLSWKLGKTRYDIKLPPKLSRDIWKTRYGFELSHGRGKYVTINQYIKAMARFLSLRLLNK